MKEVYAVSRGEYSDYSVMCVCEDEATATRFRDAYNGGDDCGDARIETMLLFVRDEQPRRETTHRAEVVLYDDGTVGTRKEWSYSQWQFDPWSDGPLQRPKVEYCRAPILADKAGFLRVIGRTAMGVAKVTSERIAAFKAKSWIPQGMKVMKQ